MRNFYLLFCFLFISTFSFSQEPFITTWEVTEDDLDINLYTYAAGQNYTYNYEVNFGDGTIITNVNGYIQHIYSEPGIYTVSISGVFPRLNIGGDYLKLLSVEQWGDIVWKSMAQAFSQCQNLIVNASDVPNLSEVTSIYAMFEGCSNFNQSINNWDVSNITEMGNAFYGCTSFNQPLNNWDVSNVVDMGSMFANATSFNQPLDSWDISNVIGIGAMFQLATSFNQPLNSWNTSNVISIGSIFENASSFNQPLDNWDVSNIEYFDSMFAGANSFNQPIENWNVSNAVSMQRMFYGSTSFNQSISNWDTSNVSNMQYMFIGASSFNHSLNEWDVSLVTNMQGMFYGSTSFNQSISNWDTSNVFNMRYMFTDASSFNQPLSSLDFSSLTYELYNFLDGSNLDVTNYDNLLTHLASSNLNLSYIGVGGLEYCNQGARDYLINTLGWTFIGDSLAENCNTVFGEVLYDNENNGCTLADIPSGGFFVNLNNGTNDFTTSVNNGSYSISATEEAYTVSLTNVPDYFTVSPVSAYVDFATTTDEQVDFCLTANQTVSDLNTTLLPLDDARPGFESNYRLVVENVGTQTISNITANLTFDDTKQSFVSSLPSNTSSSANTIEFSISSLNPFQKQEIDIVMQTFTPPTVNGDDVLSFTALVIPNNDDYTPNDNTYTFDQIVVNSFDPNDKRVLQGDFITIDETDDYLDYIIRFQNTGTANATFVRIEDVLDTDLDWNTLKITSASHAYQVTVSNGNEVEFKFDNINLPYEALDEEGSNGFIAYKIKPKSTIQLGDIMSGDASIFFDFNLPIITNIVSTEVVNPLSVNDYSNENLVSVYPNPSSNGFFIKVKNGVNVESFQVYNLQGSKLLDLSNNSEYIDTKSLMSGVYLLVINTDRGNVTEKIIIN